MANEDLNKPRGTMSWARANPKKTVFVIILLVFVAAAWAMYVKLEPFREYSGLREQPVPLGTPTGNY